VSIILQYFTSTTCCKCPTDIYFLKMYLSSYRLTFVIYLFRFWVPLYDVVDPARSNPAQYNWMWRIPGSAPTSLVGPFNTFVTGISFHDFVASK